MTRTQNSFLNLITNIFSALLVVVLNFLTRRVFIQTLGTGYLGIEGLFTNILSMLSLANLGFGTAIVFKLYKPIEEKDRHRIQVLMKLYRQVYQVMGFVIAGLGVCLIPFLPRLVRDYDTLAALHLNAVFIFLLYLFNTVSSYWFFAYKISFVNATQKGYRLTVIGYAVSLANSMSQIAALKLTGNFVIYLIVQIFFTVVNNLVYALVCDRRHPYLKEKVADKVSRQEIKELVRDCSALFLHQSGEVIIGGSDNIVLSALLGLTPVGLYANYISVKRSVSSLLYSFFRSVQASLGSLYTTGNLEWSRLIFRVINFCTVCLYGIGGIGTAILMNDFITMALGPGLTVTSWTVGGATVATPVALLVGVELYITGQQLFCSIFRSAAGLFQELKYRPIASIILNLTISLLLVPRLGIAACVISTIVANLATTLIIDPIVIFKHALKQSPRAYFLRNILYKIVVLAAGLLSWWLCSLVPLGGVAGFIVRGFICVAAPSAVFTVCFFRTVEFRFMLNTARDLLSRYVPALAHHDKGDDT